MPAQCRTLGAAIAAAAILVLAAFGQAPTTNANQNPPPIRVSGRVMLDDGTAPTSPVLIETVCNGISHTEGPTDGRGYFSVQVGQEVGPSGEASDSTGDFNRSIPHTSSLGQGFSPNDLFDNCDLRAWLGGYRSQSISLAHRGPMDSQDVGVILIHRIGESEKAAPVTATSLKVPKAASAALRKGMDLAKKDKPDEAIVSLQEAVRLDPEFAFAWNELGKLQMELGQTLEARQSLESATKAEPRWPEPYMHLARLAARSGNWTELAGVTDRVLQLNSFDYPQAFFLHAVADYNLHHPEAAEKSARSAERLDTRHQLPQIARLLGTIFADSHRYAEAADEFRNYLTLAPRASDASEVRKQLEDMEKLAAAK